MYALPDIALNTTSVEEATGDLSLVVSTAPGARGKFPPRCTVVLNGLEGLVPSAATGHAISVTVANDTRAVGDYAVQVRDEYGRVSAPVLLSITEAPGP